MASDDVLWKQVENLKADVPEKDSKRSGARNGKKAMKPTSGRPSKKARNLSPTQTPKQTASRPDGRPASQLDDLQSGQPRNGHQLGGRVVGRPVSFYIPVSVDEKIDDAVDYMQKRHGVKVDRSALVSAILGEPALWEPASLKQLAEKAVDQLTNRLASRLVSRPQG